MKKTLWIVLLVILALGALSVGIVAAQGGQPPSGQNAGADGSSLLHDYMVKAMADGIGLSVVEFEARHDGGETFYEIALAEGFSAEEIPDLMQTARAEALDGAVADGVITQDQADWMKSRGFGRGGMMGGGYVDGTCPMYPDGVNPQVGNSPGRGQGRMMGGGRWQQMQAPQGSQY